jgi:hypothetical protein
LAPSCDIAQQLGDQELLKQCLTGGRWFSKTESKWVKGGSALQDFLPQHPVLQRLLGWTDKRSLTSGVFVCAFSSRMQLNMGSGSTKLRPLPPKTHEHPTVCLKDLSCVLIAINYASFEADSQWKRCISVVTEALDESKIGSWVFFKSALEPVHMQICTGTKLI